MLLVDLKTAGPKSGPSRGTSGVESVCVNPEHIVCVEFLSGSALVHVVLSTGKDFLISEKEYTSKLQRFEGGEALKATA